MRLVRIALANVNTTVGAVKDNVDRGVQKTRAAAEGGASLVLLPEQLVGGYMQEDLVQWRAFVAAQRRAIERFAEETASLGVVAALGCTVARGDHLYSCAALVRGGAILGFVPKEKLPSYNVFYEGRTLARGAPGLFDTVNGVPFGDLVFELDFGTVAIEVCEDLWSPDGPMRRRCYAGAELVLNVSASPFRVGVVETRREMIATRSADNQCTLAYVNLVGANDGLIFDGGGYVAQNGRVLLDAPRFREGIAHVTVDLDRTRRLRHEITTWRNDQEAFEATDSVAAVHRVQANARAGKGGTTPADVARAKLAYPVPRGRSFFLPSAEERRGAREAFCEDLLDALSLGIGDYFEKTRAFSTIGVALSGGRDSLLCLILAHRYVTHRFAHEGEKAVGAKVTEILRSFYMPTRYSSAETRAAAETAARELGVPFTVLSIDDAFESELAAAQAMLAPGESVTALTRQNIQSRIRGTRMWNWSNSAGGLFLQTSNMSEKAVGYTTIGGDMEGAISVIANVPKTVVNYLLEYVREKTGSEGIRLTQAVPASAELAEGMEDEKDLMPFPVLDACFALYVGEKMSLDEVKAALAAMFPEHDAGRLDAWAAKFGRLFTQSIYKWVQTPLALHVGNLDLERERALQLPVVQKVEW